jgi:hypothetical protein
MAYASRSLIVLVVLSALLVSAWLIVGQPAPPQAAPPQRSHTPFAPIDAIGKARDAAATSDAANARVQALSDQAGTP